MPWVGFELTTLVVIDPQLVVGSYHQIDDVFLDRAAKKQSISISEMKERSQAIQGNVIYYIILYILWNIITYFCTWLTSRSVINPHDFQAGKAFRLIGKWGGLSCLTPLSTIFKLHHGGQFYEYIIFVINIADILLFRLEFVDHGICCFSAKHASIRRKNQNQDNVSELYNMSTFIIVISAPHPNSWG
jgi:hypothetical protein